MRGARNWRTPPRFVDNSPEGAMLRDAFRRELEVAGFAPPFGEHPDAHEQPMDAPATAATYKKIHP